MERQTLLHSESAGYKIMRDRLGNYTLIRKSDLKSLYFQGDDALTIEEAANHPKFNLDVWASDYDSCIETDGDSGWQRIELGE